jgi:hypothetical protein
VRPVLLSACISAAVTGRISVKFGIGDFYENLSRKSKFSYNRTDISSTLHEDLSTFIFLTAVRNIWLLENSAKGTHCCISVTTLNTFILLTARCRSLTIQRGWIVAFKLYTVFANAPQGYIICTLPILLKNNIVVWVETGDNTVQRFKCIVALHMGTLLRPGSYLTTSRGHM